MVIVGAGAAGLMTALACRRQGLETQLVDGREKFGAKILMSGGTRCNVTNVKVTEQDFNGQNLRAVRNVLSAFPSDRAAAYFRSIGVELVQEEGGKYFPATHSARTVLDALVREATDKGVVIRAGCKVTALDFSEGCWKVSGENFSFCAKAVVLCTGGLSYPASGSDGTGYRIAESLGHHLVPTSPALTPLLTDDKIWCNLSGVAVPVRLRLSSRGRVAAEYEGDFLFTHFGFSGPAALNVSRDWVRAESGERELAVNFLPRLPQEKFREQCVRESERHPSRVLRNLLCDFFPERLAEAILKKCRLSQKLVLNQWTREARELLIREIYHQVLPVSGVYGYDKAEVTAGGVSWQDVDPKTLESRISSGLFFAGEILDVDGRIGGFNFQWAWSSGVAAAEGVARKLGKKPVKFGPRDENSSLDN